MDETETQDMDKTGTGPDKIEKVRDSTKTKLRQDQENTKTRPIQTKIRPRQDQDKSKKRPREHQDKTKIDQDKIKTRPRQI